MNSPYQANTGNYDEANSIAAQGAQAQAKEANLMQKILNRITTSGEPSASSLKSYFWLAILFHFIDYFYFGLAGSTRIFMWILFSIFVVFAAKGKIGSPAMPFIYTGLTIALPFFATSLLTTIISESVIRFILLFYPIWALALAFSNGDVFTKVTIFYVITTILFVLPFLVVSYSFDLGKGIDPAQGLSDTTTFLFKTFPQSIAKAWNTTQSNYDRQINYATGGYYQGRVDGANSQAERLGVYLEAPSTVNKNFRDDEPKIYTSMLLKARTLDRPIDINLRCGVDRYEKPIIGAIYPETMNVANYDERLLDCTFDQGKLAIGSNSVKYSANFGFQTYAYVKSYFIDETTLRTLRQENIDPFSEYRITDRNPVAVFTDGPVKIGMGSQLELTGISSSTDAKPSLGITIDNNWDGIIKEVSSVRFQVPDGFSVDSERCSYQVQRTEGGVEGYTEYEFILSNSLKDIKDYRTLTCRLNIDNPSAVLGNEQLATKIFSADVTYTYEIEQQLPITIQKTWTKQLVDCNVATCDDAVCGCPSGCTNYVALRGQTCGN